MKQQRSFCWLPPPALFVSATLLHACAGERPADLGSFQSAIARGHALSAAQKTDYRYVGKLQIRSGADTILCTGFIVGCREIDRDEGTTVGMTAGHCLKGVDRNNVTFYAADAEATARSVSEIRVHPDAPNPGVWQDLDKDIALFKLTDRLPRRYAEVTPSLVLRGDRPHFTRVDTPPPRVYNIYFGYGGNVARWGAVRTLTTFGDEGYDRMRPTIASLDVGPSREHVEPADSGGPLIHPFVRTVNPDIVLGVVAGISPAERGGKVTQVFAPIYDNRTWIRDNLRAMCGRDLARAPLPRRDLRVESVNYLEDWDPRAPTVCTPMDCPPESCSLMPDGLGGWRDCGLCPESQPVCGDGRCEVGESCLTCPGDCGACGSSYCGNGICDDQGGEVCFNCPEDCGNCPDAFCGDEQCNGQETPESCPEDCGPPSCGDGECGVNEDCHNCPDDCGECVMRCEY